MAWRRCFLDETGYCRKCIIWSSLAHAPQWIVLNTDWPLLLPLNTLTQWVVLIMERLVRHWSFGRGSLNTSRFLELFHHCPLRCLGDTLALLLFIFWCDQGCTYSRMSYQNNYIFQHVSPWKHLTRSQEEVQSLISYLEPWSVYRSVCVRLIYLLITVMQTYQLCFHFTEGARIWKKSKVI